MVKAHIAYDVVLKRPACVILQSIYGCNPAVAHPFDSRHWLLAPTEDMKVYAVTDDQLRQLVKITAEANP